MVHLNQPFLLSSTSQRIDVSQKPASATSFIEYLRERGMHIGYSQVIYHYDMGEVAGAESAVTRTAGDSRVAGGGRNAAAKASTTVRVVPQPCPRLLVATITRFLNPCLLS